MQNKDKYYIIAISVLAIMLIAKTCKGDLQKQSQSDVINNYNYKTDTLKLNETLQEIRDFKIMYKKYSSTPPKLVTYYNSTNPSNVSIQKIPDSLLVILDSLNKRLYISDKYIKNYPEASKLINFNLSKNNLDITTLNTDGTLFKKDYPLSFTEYKYAWYNNELHHIENKDKEPKIKNRLNQFYMNGGYEPLMGKPLIGAEYFLILNRFKLEGNTNFTIDTEPQLRAELKLGYRLF